jgi:SPP1 gp7 family putative phage head morphogenesis protein
MSQTIYTAQGMRATEKADRRAQMWKLHDRSAAKYERPLSKAVSKYFKAQQGRYLKAFDKSCLPAVSKDIDDIDDIDWDEEDSELSKAMTAYYIAAAQDGVEAAESVYSLDIDWDLLSPAVTKWIETYGLKAAKNINETTKQKLRDTLKEGTESGESNPKLRDRIKDVYSEASTSRASLIARTETHNAYAQGNYQTYKKAGATKKQWLSAQDGRVRDSHADMDGEITAMDGSFSNGLEYPGDPAGDPAEVCNCRCTFEPVWDNDDSENNDREGDG